MEKRKVLITGSSTGTGFACTKKFISEGWKVIAHYYEETEKFNRLIENSENNLIEKIKWASDD
tara:strand:- start:298 stop:486 length:189 start_codon:yes stop_codon:yes gene_type:complete